MIDAVLIFGLLTGIGEYIILAHLPVRTRLAILGNSNLRGLFHIGFAALNLWIHWGTITGSMTAVMAFVASTATFQIARWHWGEIRDGFYYPGLVRFDELTNQRR